jgi:HAD superfamily hydrolase (TIGR01509 family)
MLATTVGESIRAGEVMGDAGAVIAEERIGGVIFDMDSVVTQTATVHARAWTRLFDDYLRERSRRTGEPFVPFDGDADYRLYVDGKARYDGVHSFLASRGIALPTGAPGDPPEAETECGLGNRKNAFFLREVEEHGVLPYPTTVALIGRLKAAGIPTAIISASENTTQVLEAAGVRELFEAQVDGLVARDLGLAGKPDPAVFIEAARRIGVAPPRAAVVEDALAGVEAGRRGGFGLVIGVDRTGHADALREHGADVVVADLAEVRVEG